MMRRSHEVKVSRIDSSTPSIRAITVIGMFWAYWRAPSSSSPPMNSSISSLAIFQVTVSQPSIWRGENAGNSILRNPVWNGGSLVIGGAENSKPSPSSPNRSDGIATLRDENVAVSCAISSMSA